MIWDLYSGEQVGALHGHTNTVYSLAYSRDGATLASGGIDNTVRLWDVAHIIDQHEQNGHALPTAYT